MAAGQPAKSDAGWYTVPVADSPRTIAITGANSGIGFAAAGKLAAAGHDVHLICRSMEKAETACADVKVRRKTTTSPTHITVNGYWFLLLHLHKFFSRVNTTAIQAMQSRYSILSLSCMLCVISGPYHFSENVQVRIWCSRWQGIPPDHWEREAHLRTV